MAIETKQITVPEHTATRTLATICDICGARSPRPGHWAASSYDVADVTIEHRWGTSYPDSTSTTTAAIDLCPACFDGKLLPWLAEQGARPRTEETDY